ncbi:MAG: TIM barrel protein [Pseudomonadota bacterium]
MKPRREWVANLFFLFREHGHADRFSAARRAGFSAVEDPWPYDLSVSDFRAGAKEAGIPVAMINTPVGDEARGDFGLGARTGREADFRHGFEHAMDYAAAVDIPIIHVMAGCVPEEDRPEADATLKANLNWAVRRAAAHGRRIVLEMINPVDRPGWFVSRTDQARGILDAVAADNLGLLFDIYHVHKVDEHVLEQIRLSAAHIAHVQVASLPDRREPGDGAVHLDDVLSALDAIGYRGFLSAEYNPASTTEAGLDWLTARIGRSE